MAGSRDIHVTCTSTSPLPGLRSKGSTSVRNVVGSISATGRSWRTMRLYCFGNDISKFLEWRTNKWRVPHTSEVSSLYRYLYVYFYCLGCWAVGYTNRDPQMIPTHYLPVIYQTAVEVMCHVTVISNGIDLKIKYTSKTLVLVKPWKKFQNTSMGAFYSPDSLNVLCHSSHNRPSHRAFWFQ